MVETVFDTLVAKAALVALEDVFGELGRRLPVILSVTITDNSGRTLSGQTPEAFLVTMERYNLLALGINCSLGPDLMRPYIEELAQTSPFHLSCYPNAGLPNAMGGYDLSPEAMAAELVELGRQGWLNLVGGCCGTGPDHIAAIAAAARELPPRRLPQGREPLSRYAGLEPLELRRDSNFTMVGERTNVTGSRRFKRLILGGEYEQAVQVARDQVDGGANILDVNMDEGMLDSVEAMATFLNIIATEPDISRVPIMIDSSRWEVIVEGLKHVQGKAVVNSISLKEGEERFREQARTIAKFGAAVVVMAFDEEGQATSTARKVEIASRAYRILVEEEGWRPRT